MQETTCPSCGGSFCSPYGVQGAPCDGFRELYCSDECRDRAQEAENQKRASRAPWIPPDPFPWGDLTDPFAE